MNAVKTVFLMTLMMALFLFIGYYLGGNTGMTIAIVFSLILNFGSFWFSDKIVLAMYRAKEVNRESAPKFYDMVDRLAKQANLPMPKVYLINDPTPTEHFVLLDPALRIRGFYDAGDAKRIERMLRDARRLLPTAETARRRAGSSAE